MSKKETRVVNVKDGSRYDVYIGRGSIWGNPYRIFIADDRREVLVAYEEYIRGSPYLLDCLEDLRGEVLGCHCKPLPCHGDILVKLLKEKDDTQTKTKKL